MKKSHKDAARSLNDIWYAERQYTAEAMKLMKIGNIEELRKFRVELSTFLQLMRSKWMNKRRLTNANKERLQKVYDQLSEVDFEIINFIFTSEKGGDFLASIKKLLIPSSVIEGVEPIPENTDDLFFSEDFLSEIARLDPPK